MSRVIDVRQEPGSTTVVVRRYNMWETIGVPLGMLVALLAQAPYAGQAGSGQDRALRSLVGILLAVLGGTVIAVVGNLLAGREEVVTASGTRLVIDRQVLRWPTWRRRRTYEVGSVKNLRAYVHQAAQKKGRFPPWLVSLAFDHNGSLTRFGAGLMGADADRVVQALTQAMRTSAP